MDEYSIFRDPAGIEELLSALTSSGVKVTAFTVGEIFKLFPEIIRLFEKYDCELEAHSYSHSFDAPDSEEEIKKARAAYFEYFNRDPLGYRAPRGKISDEGIRSLERHGFRYDSSVFPSYFPDPLKYLFNRRDPHYHKDSNIMEIPFTSLSPLRLSLSISYIKLLGLGLYTSLALPEVVCFGSHLHDFIVNEKSFAKLPPIWKLIYSRNKYNGTDLCIDFISHIKQKGYDFCYMSEIYDACKK